MDRVEAQELVQAELAHLRAKGYDSLRCDAPRSVRSQSRLGRLLNRSTLEERPTSRVVGLRRGVQASSFTSNTKCSGTTSMGEQFVSGSTFTTVSQLRIRSFCLIWFIHD